MSCMCAGFTVDRKDEKDEESLFPFLACGQSRPCGTCFCKELGSLSTLQFALFCFLQTVCGALERRDPHNFTPTSSPQYLILEQASKTMNKHTNTATCILISLDARSKTFDVRVNRVIELLRAGWCYEEESDREDRVTKFFQVLTG